MNPFLAVLIVVLVVAAALRLLTTALGVRAAVLLPRLGELDPPPPQRWPRLSILVPACNEASTVELALHTKLAQDYPSLEVIVVDDRSSDGTGGIIDGIAATDPRVRSVHVRDLPPGWLGKVHALEQGMRRVTGEWILLCDADVMLKSTTVRRAVAYAENAHLDFLTLLPSFTSVSLLIDAALADLIRAVLPMLQPKGRDRTESRFGFGCGAFMLVRRGAYDRTQGFEYLRMEVVDDMALGQMVKDASGHCGVANGRGLVQVAFYTSLTDFAHGTEKALASSGRCSYVALFMFSFVLTVVNLAAVFLVIGPWPLGVRLAGALAGVLDLLGAAVMNRAIGGRTLPALLAPIGGVLTAGLLLRSGWLALIRGGIVWRGTLYRIPELRAGMRYRFPWS